MNTMTNEIENLDNILAGLHEDRAELFHMAAHQAGGKDAMHRLQMHLEMMQRTVNEMVRINAPAKAREENTVIVRRVHAVLTELQQELKGTAGGDSVNAEIDKITRLEIQDVVVAAKEKPGQLERLTVKLVESKLPFAEFDQRIELGRACFRLDNPTGVDQSFLGDA